MAIYFDDSKVSVGMSTLHYCTSASSLLSLLCPQQTWSPGLRNATTRRGGNLLEIALAMAHKSVRIMCNTMHNSTIMVLFSISIT